MTQAVLLVKMSRPTLQHRVSSLTMSKTVVLVTGGNAGIGYEIVKKLANENSNFQVLLGTRDIHKGESAVAAMGAPTNVNPIQVDMADDESIDHAAKGIEQHFGKLDILIHNASTGGSELPRDTPLRTKYQHCYETNVFGTAVLTEAMIPLLERSSLPKIIFISSSLGSLGDSLKRETLPPVPWYSSSKTAENALVVYYAKKYPNFKINAVCPGLRATKLTGTELNEDTHPKHGATEACRVALEGSEGRTATFTRTDTELPW